MSASVNSTASSSSIPDADDVITGQRVLKYTLASMAWGLSLAAAWSCSSVVLGAIVFIIVGIVLALLAMLVELFCFFKVDASRFAAVGSVVNRTAGRVTGLFTRRAAV